MFKNQKGEIEDLLLPLFAIILLFMLLSRGALVSQSKAIRALENQGYDNIRVLDKSWFLVGLRGCDGADAVKFEMEAINPAGKIVEVNVCAGWPFKGATIRTD